jgi:hypothetical protein
MKFQINDKEVEAKKLNVLNLTTDISEVIKENAMADAVKMASFLTGKDKSQFLADAYRELPRGQELLKEATEYLSTIEGYKWIVEASTGMTEVDLEDIESYVPVIEFALGVEAQKEDAETEEAEGGEQDTAPLEIVEAD